MGIRSIGRSLRRMHFTRRKRRMPSHTFKPRDSARGDTNMSRSLVNIAKCNVGPLPRLKTVRLTYNSWLDATVSANTGSSTYFISMASVYDPEYSSIGNNKSYAYYDTVLGTANGLYQYYRVKYIDVNIKMINKASGCEPIVVLSTQRLRTTLPNTTDIHNLVGVQSSVARFLGYQGSTSWQSAKFRVYAYQAAGVSRSTYQTDTSYLCAYNQSGDTGPWLAITIGDGVAAAGAGIAQEVVMFIQLQATIQLIGPNCTTSV